MWIYIWLGQVFLIYNVISVNTQINRTHQNTSNETVCTDIVKNISRVNNALKEVIKNYKQLQKISKTQSFETDFDPDENRNITNERSQNDATKTTIFPATSMLFANKDEESAISDETNEKPLSKYKDIHNKSVKVADDIPTSDSQEVKVKENQKITATSKVVVKSLNRISIENVSRSEPSEPKDALKKFKAHSRYRAVDRILMSNNYRKRRRRITTTDLRPSTIRMPRVKPQINQNIKKVVYTETFSGGKIWNDIINKKPLHLRTNLNKSNHATNVSKTLHRINLKKVTVNKLNQTTGASWEEDMAIKRDIFKTDVLRKAYGDTCLKVVVRKCFKACKGAVKPVCRQYRCKNSFEEKFKQYCKTGCIKEFNAGEKHNKETQTRNNHVDYTRNGYCGASCLPDVKPYKTNETKANRAEVTTKKSSVDILRDRFEKACQDESKKKCCAACTFAYQETCSSLDCSTKQKKSFKKTCDAQCKKTFVSDSSKSKSKSTESSESTGSSDGGSDDNSSSSSKS